MHWQAAEAWNKASKEEKAPHVLAAEREKVQYERLCDEYAMRKEAASAAGAADMARHVGGAEVQPHHPLVCIRLQHTTPLHSLATHNTSTTACQLTYLAQLPAPHRTSAQASSCKFLKGTFVR